MGLSDTQRIPYLVRDGVLRIAGELKYQDRELRIACMVLLSGPQPVVCVDVRHVPSLCSPEIQFLAKMAKSAQERGKKLKVRLSTEMRKLFHDLELDGLVEIEEFATKAPAVRDPAAPPAKPQAPEIISLFRRPGNRPSSAPKAAPARPPSSAPAAPGTGFVSRSSYSRPPSAQPPKNSGPPPAAPKPSAP